MRFILAIVMTICASVPTFAAAQTLPGSAWVPYELHGLPFEPTSETFIGFEQDGQFFGKGGCNSMRGSFATNQGAILFGAAAMTRMACPDDVNRLEFAFARALSAVRFFERSDTDLVLKDGGGIVIMRLSLQDAE